MLSIKEGVSIRGLQPQMAIALTVASLYLDTLNIDCVLTSASEGKHSQGSLHYLGVAIDIRTSNIPDNGKVSARNKLQILLGQEFDVVLEDDHIHIEYQPKG